MDAKQLNAPAVGSVAVNEVNFPSQSGMNVSVTNTPNVKVTNIPSVNVVTTPNRLVVIEIIRNNDTVVYHGSHYIAFNSPTEVSQFQPISPILLSYGLGGDFVSVELPDSGGSSVIQHTFTLGIQSDRLKITNWNTYLRAITT